ncbi:c6 transcription factor [Fusarium beomiforme]|uniref:C6 transcription factor n=1 Tax=Fusarium beomiforme TaxID=44412 RepID=A0A9P5E271_9HYPO|nr:c6 transcription factor [Fusarium beomiforme]
MNMELQNQSVNDATVLECENFTVKTLSQSTAHYSGEFSHWNFSHRVRQKVTHCLGAIDSSSPSYGGSSAHDDGPSPTVQKPEYLEYWRATQLQGPSSRIRGVINILPPKSIARFLVRVYLDFAQVNSFFVQDKWLYEKLEILYEQPQTLTSSSTAWVCSVILVLAIGTQFAHMGSGDLAVTTTGDAEEDSPDREAGTYFYQTAATLLPDIITMASLESVQACLLLAHYTLPLDTHGLAYTYLGLAIKMAIQNGMHRKPKGVELNAWTVETRNRLWWAAFTVERRVSVLHGRPASITAMEIDTDLPKDLAEFRQDDEPSNFDNMMSMITLTNNLGDIATALKLLKKCPKDMQATYFERIFSIRGRLIMWWSSLPGDIQTPSESSPLFRSNVHLKLNYHLVQIFTGRPFIFLDTNHDLPTEAVGNETPRQSRRVVLVSDALEAAFNVIILLELLHEAIGLARASYIEFSSCRAAVLLLLAHSLNQSTERLRMAVRQGMGFLKVMSRGSNMSTKSETSLIETIELAVRRLRSQNNGMMTGEKSDKQELQTSYDRFKEWTALCVGASASATDTSTSEPVSGFSDLAFSDGMTTCQDAGDTMDDLEDWMRQISDGVEADASDDVPPDNQMQDTIFVATTTSETSWEDIGWR